MVTKTLRRTPQLPPDEIENRLMRGQEIVLASSEAQRKRLVTTYKLGSGDISDYQNAARFFLMSGLFPSKLVFEMPWSVLLELSRPTKDEETRIKLSWLCMLWADAYAHNETPCIYAFPTDKPLVMAILNHFDNYINDLRVIFAQAKRAGIIDLPLEIAEDDYIDCELPDIVNRVREEMGIVVNRGVEAAILRVKAIATNGLLKVEQLNHVEQTSRQVQTVLEQVQDYLQTLMESDSSIIVTSLKNHAQGLERQLYDALTINQQLLDRAINAENLCKELDARAESAEEENAQLKSKLSTVATYLDMLREELKPVSNSDVTEVAFVPVPEQAEQLV